MSEKCKCTNPEGVFNPVCEKCLMLLDRLTPALREATHLVSKQGLPKGLPGVYINGEYFELDKESEELS